MRSPAIQMESLLMVVLLSRLSGRIIFMNLMSLIIIETELRLSFSLRHGDAKTGKSVTITETA